MEKCEDLMWYWKADEVSLFWHTNRKLN